MRTPEEFQWQLGAACLQLPAAIAGADFFPENRRSEGAKLAKQFCGVCQVRQQCLRFALDNDEQYGIWGGTDPRERAWLKAPEVDFEHSGQEQASA